MCVLFSTDCARAIDTEEEPGTAGGDEAGTIDTRYT